MKKTKEKYSQQNPGPYEIAIDPGVHALSDAQLLAVILRTGTGSTDATGLAKTLLAQCESDRGLSGLRSLSAADMTSIEGIGRVKAAQLLCVCEIARRMGKTTDRLRKDFSKPEMVAAYYMSDMAHLDKEKVIAVMLDTRCRFIKDTLISVGGSDFAIANPKDIFCEVLKAKASGFILLHNHPSGDPTPSGQDKMITDRIKLGAELLGVRFLDHIVIGHNRYVSMKTEGML